MQIDARKQGPQDLMTELKGILASKHGCNVSIDIILDTTDDAQRITSFVSMSGCKTEIDKKENYYIMHVTGIPCCA